MKTQRTFEPHEFEAHAEAENVCRHCNRGRYALHHQTTEHDDHNAPAALDERAKCSHSDKSWRLSGNNPADIMCEYDYIAIGTTRKHASQIVTEHNQHSTLIAQRKRLLRLLRPVTSPTACYCAVMGSEKCWHCEARELITTIEQDQITSRTTSEQEGR